MTFARYSKGSVCLSLQSEHEVRLPRVSRGSSHNYPIAPSAGKVLSNQMAKRIN